MCFLTWTIMWSWVISAFAVFSLLSLSMHTLEWGHRTTCLQSRFRRLIMMQRRMSGRLGACCTKWLLWDRHFRQLTIWNWPVRFCRARSQGSQIDTQKTFKMWLSSWPTKKQTRGLQSTSWCKSPRFSCGWANAKCVKTTLTSRRENKKFMSNTKC